MNRKISFAVGEFYHIYNRGNDKKIIFRDEKDRIRFTHLLFLCNNIQPVVYKTILSRDIFNSPRKQLLVDIGAYCLMPNHFHILIYERAQNGISIFMKKISTAYSMYFNLKNKRTGKLFEGVFKAQHVNDDQYLRYLYAYIHLNPIKLVEPKWEGQHIKNINQAKAFLKKFSHSSFLDYTGYARKAGSILSKNAFPEYFSEKHSFTDFVDDLINSKVFPKNI